MSAWTMLVFAGLLEIVWASLLKRTEGFTRPGMTAATLAAMVASFYLLARAMRTLPAGTSYAVWVGIGAVGTLIVGATLMRERITGGQWVCAGLVVAGIVGIKALSAREAAPAPEADGAGREAGLPG